MFTVARLKDLQPSRSIRHKSETNRETSPEGFFVQAITLLEVVKCMLFERRLHKEQDIEDMRIFWSVDDERSRAGTPIYWVDLKKAREREIRPTSKTQTLVLRRTNHPVVRQEDGRRP